MSLAPDNIRDTSLLDDAGRRVPAQAVRCDFCRRSDTIRAGSHGLMPPHAARKKFIQRGWDMGKKATCPRCVAKFKAASKAKAESRVIPMTTAVKSPLKTMADLAVVKATGPAATPPRDMTAVDRRRVFREIDENWDDANARYLGDATDQSIAAKLVAPRAWVETIRRENFGEVSANDEIEKLRAELVAFIGVVDGHCNDALAQATRFDTVLKGLGDLRARMERIEKSVGLRK